MSENSNTIELKKIGVCYQIYRERIFSLKEAAISSFKRLGGLFSGDFGEPGHHDFWALREIEFNVAKGETLGLVGRNGSGKSTLLKVISGVIHPSEGELSIKGRVSALVELGAGFDPELTGRENIYFGASALGLSRKETDFKMDRIIDFSELKEFVDMPVKNYSSGMYARLGFALATDVDPDILIIDEILSVGDAPFQEKCLDRMNAFKKKGVTILFVSHAGEQTQTFCHRIIELSAGKIVSDSKTTASVS
jgi:ABC-type polysaccharide/polyol phosphate transport system ATPase subunit